MHTKQIRYRTIHTLHTIRCIKLKRVKMSHKMICVAINGLNVKMCRCSLKIDAFDIIIQEGEMELDEKIPWLLGIHRLPVDPSHLFVLFRPVCPAKTNKNMWHFKSEMYKRKALNSVSKSNDFVYTNNWTEQNKTKPNIYKTAHTNFIASKSNEMLSSFKCLKWLQMWCSTRILRMLSNFAPRSCQSTFV